MKKHYLLQSTLIIIALDIIAAFFLLSQKSHAQVVPPISQFTTTSTPPTLQITQTIFGRPIKITGLVDGCLYLSGSILSSTGVVCGGGGGGGTFPFTIVTHWGQTTAGTTTALFLQGSPFSLFASSTSAFDSATSTNLEAKANLWLSYLTSGGLAVDANHRVYSAATTTFSSPLLYSAGNVTCQTSTDSLAGCLSAADHTTFNAKQAAGNYITALTGDVTASGPGSVTATLATVNVNTGSFGGSTAIPNFTVNGKGLIIAAGTSVVIAPAGTLTGTTLASNVVTSSLTSANLAALTATNGSLTFSGSYNGNTAQTVGLNVANPNNWTGLQTFTNASSSLFSVTNKAYFGGTATTTIDSTGNVVIPSGSSLSNTGRSDGCATWSSTVLTSTGIACGSGAGTNYFTNAGITTSLNTGSVLAAGNFTATSTSATSTLPNLVSSNLNGAIYIDGTNFAKTAAGINSAITYQCLMGGGAVVLPIGTISISSSIVINCDNIILSGAGPSSILQNANSFNDYTIKVNDAALRSRLVFQDFAIDGNSSNQTTGGCIMASSTARSTIQRTVTTNCKSENIKLGPVTGGSYGYNNQIVNNYMGLGRIGLDMAQNDENFVYGNTINSMSLYHIEDESGLQDIEHNTLTGVSPVTTGIGVYIRFTGDSKVIANTFDTIPGISIYVQGNTTQGNSQIIDNHIYKPSDNGGGDCAIVFDGSIGNVVSNNYVGMGKAPCAIKEQNGTIANVYQGNYLSATGNPYSLGTNASTTVFFNTATTSVPNTNNLYWSQPNATGLLGFNTPTNYGSYFSVNGNHVFDIASSTNATSTLTGGLNIAAGCFAINNVCVTGGGTGSGTVNAGVAGQATYYAANGTTVSGTTTLTIGTTTADANNVGVGTTSPSLASLTVSTQASNKIGLVVQGVPSQSSDYFRIMKNDNTNVLTVDSSGTVNTGPQLQCVSAVFCQYQALSVDFEFKAATAGKAIKFTTGGSTWAYFAGSQQLGLGTSTPGALLSLAGGSGGTTPLFLLSTSTSGFATSTALMVDQNGKIGIGTTTPVTGLTLGTSAIGITYPDDTLQTSNCKAIFQDQKTALTAAGGSNAGVQTRTLNTTSFSNCGAQATLASNQVTLAAGTWCVDGLVPSFGGDRAKSVIFNVSDTATTTVLGMNGFADNGTAQNNSMSYLKGCFTTTATKTFEVRQFITTARATNGLGLPMSTSQGTEVYTTVEFDKQ